MKELKIGETITIKCVECGDCRMCSLFRTNCVIGNELASCIARQRTDHKNVHFEVVENDYTELQKRNEAYLDGRREKEEDMRMMLDSQRQELIDKAVKYIDENVGTLTAISLRKYMEEGK